VVASIATHITRRCRWSPHRIVKAKRLAKRRKRQLAEARDGTPARRAASADTRHADRQQRGQGVTGTARAGPQVGTAPSAARRQHTTHHRTSASRACAPVIVRGYVRPSGATSARERRGPAADEGNDRASHRRSRFELLDVQALNVSWIGRRIC